MLYEDTAPAFSRWLDPDFRGVCCCRLVHAQTHHAFTMLTLQTRGLSRAVLRQAALPAPLRGSFSTTRSSAKLPVGVQSWHATSDVRPGACGVLLNREMHDPEHEVALSTAGRDRCLLCPIGPIQKRAASGT